MKFLVLLMLGACATANRNPVRVRGSHVLFNKPAVAANAATENITKPAEVEVFYERSPDRKVKELGLVEAFAEGPGTGVNFLLPELQRQGGLMGARGVYKIKIQRFNHAVEALHATAIAFE